MSFIESTGVVCSERNGYRRCFPKLLRRNYLEVAGSILTAGE